MRINNIKPAFIINDKLIVVGDKITLTYYDNSIRSGILIDIDTRYKSLTVAIQDSNMPCGIYHLHVDLENIKDVDKDGDI
jgi:hypothetical protein